MLYTLRNAAGDERKVCSTKELVRLAATGWRVVESRWM